MSKELFSSEDEARKLAVELRILEGTIESLQSRMNLLNAAHTELSIANRTIEGIKDGESDVSVLVPIGGGSYITAKLDDVNKVVYGVGAGVAIEKKSDKAKENIENRISELEKTRKSMEQQLSQLIRRYRENQGRLQQLSNNLGTLERR